jgi:two-component system CheB/CheR fusion protein
VIGMQDVPGNPTPLESTGVRALERDSLPGTEYGPSLAPTGPTIVGIGASAGGLDAFTRLLRGLRSDTGLAYVLVQHLAPDHDSRLPEILHRAATIPISHARDGERLEANHAYVIPPNSTMTAVDDHLRLVPRPDRPQPHLPIDAFLSSLAEVHGAGAIGVILSGAGSDGARGVQAIKEVGGITFAQDSASAGHPNMPEAAVATGCVDFVLPPEEIANQLAEIGRFIVRASPERVAPDDAARPSAGDDLRTLFTLLRQRTGVDFTHYRAGTVQRRVVRRMLLHRVESRAEYVAYVRDRPAELDLLYEDLLIGVSSFFRDPEVFTELRETGFPALLRGRAPGAPLRIWVAGCSGGEETYSLAIALLEFLEEAETDIPIQVFATDLSESAIARGRAAVYPESIAEQVSAERLRRFFVPEHGKYRIAKFVRDLCVFSRHNIVSDPPFSHLDLISCRNVLIYFDPSLQRRVFPTFHYALESHGLLLLGGAETPGAGSDLFEPVARRHKLYRRRNVPTRALDTDFGSLAEGISTRGRRASGGSEPWEGREGSPSALARSDLAAALDRVILGNFAQRGVVVDEQFRVLHFRGDTSRLLSHASGTATLNLLQLARAELVTPLRLAVTRSIGSGQPTRESHVALTDSGATGLVTIDVFPVPSASAQRAFVVLFSDEPQIAPAQESEGRRGGGRSRAPRGRQPAEIQSLRDELAAMKTYVSVLIEEQEGTVEELRAAGEEIQSSNEELQGTNEELETTKEEIQSTNEELTTLNEELNHRNRELGELASDLANVFACTTIPIIIVGRDLRIRRFTPTSSRVMRLIPTDVGRPLGDVRLSFALPNLEQLLRTAIETLAVTEHIVHDESHHWWSLTIRPYQTVDRRVDGAVLVFSDVDTSKRAEESATSTSEGRREALAVAEEARITALARANEALAMGIADRERAEVERNALLRRLDSAREEERRHLSRELHDEVGQHLTALGLGLQALSDIAPPASDIDRRAEELRLLAGTLSQELHDIAVRLRPRILDDFGFEAALSSFVEAWSRRTQIAADFHSSAEAARLPPLVESAAYRIAQEALTNVARHSKATRASVVVERRHGHLHTIIEDNGKGFDPGELNDSSRPGLGLLGIRERVALLGGTFEIESSSDHGTTVFVRLPIEGRGVEGANRSFVGPSDG